YLGGAEDLSIDACCPRFGSVPAVFVEAPRVRGNPKRPALVPPHRLPGFPFQALVDLDCFEYQPAVRIAVRVKWNYPRRMPSGPGGEFGTLEQGDVRPASARQAIEDIGADCPTPNDHDTSMGPHPTLSPRQPRGLLLNAPA